MSRALWLLHQAYWHTPRRSCFETLSLASYLRIHPYISATKLKGPMTFINMVNFRDRAVVRAVLSNRWLHPYDNTLETNVTPDQVGQDGLTRIESQEPKWSFLNSLYLAVNAMRDIPRQPIPLTCSYWTIATSKRKMTPPYPEDSRGQTSRSY